MVDMCGQRRESAARRDHAGASPSPAAHAGRAKQDLGVAHVHVDTASARGRCPAAGLVAAFAIVLGIAVAEPAWATPPTVLHHAPNRKFDSRGRYVPGRAGFNLADVNSPAELDSLPDDVKGLVWIGLCTGADPVFIRTVRPYIGNPRLFGFYLMDDPDPTGRYGRLCRPADLRAESDWIRANAPGAKTFVVLMNLSSSKAPSFMNTYNPANAHVDLYGIDPYPCRTEFNDCDYDMIDRYVTAAKAWGIPRDRMIPVFQAFGGGDWTDDAGGKYRMPSVGQLKAILTRWRALVPAPIFDSAYSWGSQRNDAALEGSPELQSVFSAHNQATKP